MPGRAESTAAGQDEQDADSSSAHREGGSGKPPLRGGPWKGLASIFRRRPPPAPSPLAPADSAAYLQTQLEQLKGSRAAEQRAPRGVRTRAAATTNASTQPSMCSTPPSPFADDAGEPSLCSSPRSADAKPIPGPLPGDGAKEARCPSCNAQLPHTTDPALQAASVASHVATDQRRISGASETPSLREWSRGGLLPQLCNDCSRCAATALQQRTYVPPHSSSSQCSLQTCVCICSRMFVFRPKGWAHPTELWKPSTFGLGYRNVAHLV